MNDDGKGPSEEKQPCMKRARATASWQDIDNPAKKKRTTHGGNKFLRNALPTGWKEETKHRQGGLRKGQAYPVWVSPHNHVFQTWKAAAEEMGK